MRISEIARRAGVTAKTVRYYESLGLITPARLANGYRDYSERDARMVREARELNRLGIPVERTRPFLACLADGRDHADDCPASLAGYREAIDDLTLRIEELTTRRSVLAGHLHRAAHRNSRAAWRRHRGGRREPPDRSAIRPPRPRGRRSGRPPPGPAGA